MLFWCGAMRQMPHIHLDYRGKLFGWTTLRDKRIRKLYAHSEPTFDHPLKSMLVVGRIPRRILGSGPSTGRATPVSTPATISEPLAQALKKLDPLSQMAIPEEMDPLSKMAAEMDTVDSAIKHKEQSTKSNPKSERQDSWSHRKAAILQKYTTSEKLSMVTSFLQEGEKVAVKAQSTAVDKVQHRLEQLDSFEEGPQRKLDLSQTEYIFKIDQLHKELILAWNIEQRVKALKIAIQCAKMLADTDVLPFYPSKFVLITDILDCFGKLVYDRLHSKAMYYKPGSQNPIPLPENFTPNMVSDQAKETCLNWFFKIASIRELVPRLYIEMALLNSYSFISANECPEALTRLTEMIKGIGNPLVAVYARCYLCRVGLKINAHMQGDVGYFRRNFECFLETYQHIFSRSVKGNLHEQKMSISSYMTLYTPALDFIMDTVLENSPDTVLTELLRKCQQYSNSSLILNTIMSGFKPTFIAERTLQFLYMIAQCTDDGIPLHSLLRTLGLCISICSPPAEDRKQILNGMWTNVAPMKDPAEYIGCIEAWIPYIVQHFSTKELNTILSDIIDHMSPNRISEKYTCELRKIVQKIMQYSTDFESLLAMEYFLPFLDLFHEESIKVEICKLVLTSNFLMDQKTNDPVIINALMFLAGVLHDSVNALSPEDEIRQIGEILCNVARCVDYGRNFEQQLHFYVDARGSFANLDVVLAQLVQSANFLSANTRQIVKGHHTKRTADFVRACSAYCFITIPSIESPKVRLKLYLLSGQVALYNHCLGQADACFKAVLSIIPELPLNNENESFLHLFIQQFLSILLVVPDNPERGILSLVRSLVNVLRSLAWNQQNCILGYLYVNIVDLLASMTQDVFPYHVDGVESNDSLWGADSRFIKELDSMISVIIGELLGLLKELGACRKQSQIAIELFIRICIRADLSAPQTFSLALNLWNLALKNVYAETKYICRTREYLKNRSLELENIHLQQLVEKLSIPSR
ncbi:VPS35 endosomal protein-sorting factor-like isoform X1 [Anthonomus grandis grandis]|uniref:VPS35 endosomal protein-sorting factor-like isoform X1 n=2 Tax=Anthonomus grandis grandis TaxID=2921223 RepID=UPI0021655239|nr:VPS35 endosomal protein-sorting factor-like isoform X1 [Anthonomus grandis grandis]